MTPLEKSRILFRITRILGISIIFGSIILGYVLPIDEHLRFDVVGLVAVIGIIVSRAAERFKPKE